MPLARTLRIKVVSGQSMAPSATLAGDVDVTGYRRMTVLSKLVGGATAAADLSQFVQPYDLDDTTVSAGLPQRLASTPTLASGIASMVRQYDLDGLSKVRIYLVNLNATVTLTGSVHVLLSE